MEWMYVVEETQGIVVCQEVARMDQRSCGRATRVGAKKDGVLWSPLIMLKSWSFDLDTSLIAEGCTVPMALVFFLSPTGMVSHGTWRPQKTQHTQQETDVATVATALFNAQKRWLNHGIPQGKHHKHPHGLGLGVPSFQKPPTGFEIENGSFATAESPRRIPWKSRIFEWSTRYRANFVHDVHVFGWLVSLIWASISSNNGSCSADS